MSDISRRASFDIIRYASVWEDADILVESLAITSGTRSLSIASGGDNALAMLARGGELVVAADISPAQLACVQIKTAAFAGLEYERFLQFLGFRQSSQDRLATYRELRERLPQQAREFWDGREEIVRAGVIHGGKFEHYFHLFRRRVLPLVHSRRDVRSLLEPKSRAEREEFYRRRWDTWRWRLMFRIFFSRFVMGRMGRDPEFFRYVEGSVAERILNRVEHALTALPAHTNPYMTYILTGNFGMALPAYARPENFEAIRGNLERLEIFHGGAVEAARKFGRFDACNLSDIFEYMAPAEFRTMAAELVQQCRPGARLAYWNMLVPRRISLVLPDTTEPMTELSERMFMKDQAFFYQSFFVDKVLG